MEHVISGQATTFQSLETLLAFMARVPAPSVSACLTPGRDRCASGHIGGTKQKAIHAQEAVYLSQVAALSCSAFTRHVRSVAVERSRVRGVMRQTDH